MNKRAVFLLTILLLLLSSAAEGGSFPVNLPPDEAALVMGKKLLDRGDLDLAALQFKRVRMLSTSLYIFDWATLWLGIIYLERGDTAALVDEFKKRLSPWEETFFLLGNLYEGNYDTVITCFREAHPEEVKSYSLQELFARYIFALSLMRADMLDSAAVVMERITRDYKGSVLYGEVLYRLAGFDIERGEYDSAVATLEEAIDFYRVSLDKSRHWWVDDALFLEAVAHYEKGEVEKGDSILEQLVSISPGTAYASRVERIRSFYRMKSGGVAFEDMLPVDTTCGDDAVSELLLEAGYFCLDRKEEEKALEYFKGAGKLASDPSLRQEALVFAGEVSYRLHRFVQATKVYTEAYNTDSDTYKEDALYGLAWSYYRREKFSIARELFSEFLRRYPHSPVAVRAEFAHAKTYYNQGLYQEAAEELEDFARDCNSFLCDDALFLLGEIYSLEGEYRRSGESYERLFSTFPTSALARESMFRAARNYLDAGVYSRVVDIGKEFERMGTRDEFYDRTELLVYTALFKLGEFESYIEAMKSFIARYPDSPLVPSLVLDIGGYYEASEMYTEAAEEYSSLLTLLSPDSIWCEASFRLGRVALKGGDVERAEQVINRLLSEFPASPRAADGLEMLADHFEKEGNDGKLLFYSEKLARFFPDEEAGMRGLLKMARLYERLGKEDEARLIYDEIARRSMENELTTLEEAVLGKVNSFLKEGRLSDAISYADSAKASFPQDKLYLLCEITGDTYMQLEEYESAVSEYQMALASGKLPQEVTGQLYLKIGKALAMLDRFDEACSYFSSCLRITNEDSTRQEAEKNLRIYRSFPKTNP
ncbi:tetratricopeptide repeat protein [bacterium]|nr:tetratricopeptide repeat protein [bacterium]